jgi:DNA-binding NtrC family response regulator
VRELENLVHREVLLSDDSTIELAARLPGGAPAGVDPGAKPCGFERGFHAARTSWIEEFERRFICWALQQERGNVSAAARRAGKERRSFGRLVKKYAVDPARFATS